MTDEFNLGPKAVAQVRELIQREAAMLRNPDAGQRGRGPVNDFEKLQGFLQTNLTVASNSIVSPSTAYLSVWYRPQGSTFLADAGRTVTVTNRFTDFAASAGDYLVVSWVDGEWQPVVSQRGRIFAAKVGASPVTARSGTTPGSGTVTLYGRVGTTLTSLGVNVTAYNASTSQISADEYINVGQDPTGDYWALKSSGGGSAFCIFSLNSSLATSDSSKSANVEIVWGDTSVAVDDTIDVYNHPTSTGGTYIFEGDGGDYGTAVWDSSGSKWRIIQMECP